MGAVRGRLLGSVPVVPVAVLVTVDGVGYEEGREEVGYCVATYCLCRGIQRDA